MASSSTEISKDHPSTGRPGPEEVRLVHQCKEHPPIPRRAAASSESVLHPMGGIGTSPVSSNVSVKWNEESVKRTLHPRDKDYGLMKVSEPKTPFIYDEAKKKSPVSAEVLAQSRPDM
ncbi:hypothetical protein MRX96_042998 [Rhipicephalus microplus]